MGDIEKITIFAAIEIPKDLRKRLYAFTQKIILQKAKVKWVCSDHMHITLHFFGDCNSSELEEIRAITRVTVEKYKPFDLTFSTVGIFPDVRRPRIIWVGLSGEVYQLQEMQEYYSARLQDGKYQVDKKKYHPHVTIGRVKAFNKDQTFIEACMHKEIEISDTFAVKSVMLCKSVLTENGPQYTILDRFQLKG